MDRLAGNQQAKGRQDRYLRELGLPTLFGAIVLLGSATLLLLANISALRSSLNAIEHTQGILVQLAELEAGILGDELTVRGYALTGDRRFVAFQAGERDKVRRAEAELIRLSASEGDMAGQYRRVFEAVDRHTEIFGRLTGYGPDRAAMVARAIVDPAVRANMAAARTGLAALRTAEVHRLGDRQRRMTNQITRAFALALGIIVAAFLLGGVGVWAARLQSPFERRPRLGERFPASKA